MSEQKSNTTAIVIVAGAVLGLCCVSSAAAAMLFGVASPMALLSGFEDSTPPGVITARVAVAPTGIEGVWSRGVSGLPEFRDPRSTRWNAPKKNGSRYVFRSDGTCEVDVMTHSEAVGCSSYELTSVTDCRWGVAVTDLTVELGEGAQVTKTCSGEPTTGTAKARTVTAKVTLNDDRLTLVHPDATFEYQREP